MNIRLAVIMLIMLIISIYPVATLFGQVNQSVISSEESFDYFDKLYKVDPRLVNGDFYQIPLISLAVGHPFFMGTEWKNGSLEMDGVDFDNLLLRYDISTDQVILNSADFTNAAIQLVLKKDLIGQFTMNGYTFEPYPEDDPFNGRRFCQVYFNGDKIDLLILRSKKLKVTPTGLSEFEYQLNEEIKIRFNDELIPYRGRKSLMRIFPDLKQELKTYLRNNKLKMRRMSLPEHGRYISYCNQLLEAAE
jgi:hypothetical protein